MLVCFDVSSTFSYPCAAQAYRLNKISAQVARKAADEVTAETGK